MSLPGNLFQIEAVDSVSPVRRDWPNSQYAVSGRKTKITRSSTGRVAGPPAILQICRVLQRPMCETLCLQLVGRTQWKVLSSGVFPQRGQWNPTLPLSLSLSFLAMTWINFLCSKARAMVQVMDWSLKTIPLLFKNWLSQVFVIVMERWLRQHLRPAGSMSAL